MRIQLSVNRITRCAVLTALALVLSLFESTLPQVIPLPGMKLGLANIVTLYALYALGTADAFLILVLRVVLGAMFAGQITAFMYSFTGGMLSMLAMVFVKRLSHCSIYGVSVSGAAAHSLGQVLAAMLLTRAPAPVMYLGPLLLASPLTGGVSALVVGMLLGSEPLRNLPNKI